MIRRAVGEAIAKHESERPPATEPEVLKTKQAARMIGVNDKRLLAMVRRNEINAHWLGREPRFLRSELLDWIKAHRQQRAAAS